MPERHRIEICTLYAPCASRRRYGHGWRAPVSSCEIRGKSGAGERTRTADLLITNHSGAVQPRPGIASASAPQGVSCREIVWAARTHCAWLYRQASRTTEAVETLRP